MDLTCLLIKVLHALAPGKSTTSDLVKCLAVLGRATTARRVSSLLALARDHYLVASRGGYLSPVLSGTTAFWFIRPRARDYKSRELLMPELEFLLSRARTVFSARS